MRRLSPNINPRTVNAHCAKPERYTANAPRATENEALDFLWGLVRILQPDNIVEVGTYRADGTRALRDALSTNGQGVLHTIEIDATLASAARKEFEHDPHVVVYENDFFAWSAPFEHAEFVFLDGEPKRLTSAYYEHTRSFLPVGGFLAVHDTGTAWPTRDHLQPWIANGELTGFHLPCPRGLDVYRRTS